MTYDELLTKMSSDMKASSSTASSSNKEELSYSNEDTTSNLLNKIGLEVQRQGGY